MAKIYGQGAKRSQRIAPEMQSYWIKRENLTNATF